METTPAPVTPPTTKTSYGAIAGLLIIVAAIVIGALYFLKERVSDGVYSQDPGTSLAEQGTSTDPKDIEADLEAKSADEFDADIDQAFVELDAAFSEE